MVPFLGAGLGAITLSGETEPASLGRTIVRKLPQATLGMLDVRQQMQAAGIGPPQLQT